MRNLCSPSVRSACVANVTVVQLSCQYFPAPSLYPLLSPFLSVSLWSLLQIFMLYISFGTLFEFICWLCRAVAILFARPMIVAVVVGCYFLPDVFISLTSVWLATSICQNFRTESDLFNCCSCY